MASSELMFLNLMRNLCGVLWGSGTEARRIWTSVTLHHMGLAGTSQLRSPVTRAYSHKLA